MCDTLDGPVKIVHEKPEVQETPRTGFKYHNCHRGQRTACLRAIVVTTYICATALDEDFDDRRIYIDTSACHLDRDFNFYLLTLLWGGVAR